MDHTQNDAERLAYKERQHNVVTSNASIADYSFDLQAQKWCQFILKVYITTKKLFLKQHIHRKNN